MKGTPLALHPNPYFERKSYLSLNGEWDFRLDKAKHLAAVYPLKINVPFAIETEASGINKKIKSDDFLHYRYKLEVPSHMMGKLLRLVFSYVDQVTDVYFNGVLVKQNRGGYLPFDVYLKDYQKENLIEVVVKDNTESQIYPRGKQASHPGGIWYTSTSGIYGPVYLEALPLEGHLKQIKITPDYDKEEFHYEVEVEGPDSELFIEASVNNKEVFKFSVPLKDRKASFTHPATDKDRKSYVYSLENPQLYDFKFTYLGDEVYTHAGLRKYSSIKVNNLHLIAMNNKPLFVSSLLDQGYWPKSGLTPSSYDDYAFDLEVTKKMGFIGLRKHIKFEIPRFYYMADKAGILIAQDLVNGGSKYKTALITLAPFFKLPIKDSNYKLLGRGDIKSRNFFINSIKPSLDLLHNSASLFMWTIFNEGWGQFDSVKTCDYVRSLDSSRLIDAHSGWFDHKAGDFNSKHVYFRHAHLRNDHKRILILSEFGGYSLKIPGHIYAKKAFGYRFYKSKEKLNKALAKLFKKDVIKNILRQGLSMSTYTQLSDVEGEVNGLLTYERSIEKVEIAKMKKINEEIYKTFDNKYKEK